jgi:uncharacterized protein YwgA
MNRLEKIAAILRLIEKLKAAGSWCGETHIQKALYLLQELTDVTTYFEYVLYKHGPFSFELHDELASICVDGLVRIVPQPAPYGPRWEITDAGCRFEGKFVDLISKLDPPIAFVAKNLGNKTVAELERLATALLVSRDSWTENAQSRARRLNELKRHVTGEKALQAVHQVDSLRADWQQIGRISSKAD